MLQVEQHYIYGNASSTLSTSRPWARGETYGVMNNGKFYFYNGLMTGKTAPYIGAVTGRRSGSTIVEGGINAGDESGLLGAYLK